MKKLIFTTVTIIVFGTSISSAQYNSENLKIKHNSEVVSGINNMEQYDVSYSFENLRLFPVIANEAFVNSHKDLGKFTVLKDAIEQNKITISETGASQPINTSSGLNQSNGNVSGTVNTLIAENISTDTVFIMAGEIVKGGKQDRVIGQDVVLAPGQKMDLSAFCVEQNRWTTKDNNGGQFTGYYNVTSMDIRKSVTEEKNQSEVWRKVEDHTSKNGAGSDTKTYTNLENSTEYQTKVNAYMEKFKTAFSDNRNVIGVIAVTGDKVIGCDLFATHDLFINAYANIIYSYVGEAITNGLPVVISNEKVSSYLNEILNSEENQKEKIEENGTIYEYQNKKLHITKY